MSNSYDVTSKVSTSERRALALSAVCEAGNIGDRKALAEAQVELAEAAAADDVAHGRVTVATVLETVRALLLQVIALGAYFKAKNADRTTESTIAFMLKLFLNAAIEYAKEIPANPSHIFGASCRLARDSSDRFGFYATLALLPEKRVETPDDQEAETREALRSCVETMAIPATRFPGCDLAQEAVRSIYEVASRLGAPVRRPWSRQLQEITRKRQEVRDIYVTHGMRSLASTKG